MSSEVKRLAETIRVTEVSSIVLTEISTVGGQSVRSLRFYGSAGEAAFPVLEVQVSSEDPETIKVTTPEIRF